MEQDYSKPLSRDRVMVDCARPALLAAAIALARRGALAASRRPLVVGRGDARRARAACGREFLKRGAKSEAAHTAAVGDFIDKKRALIGSVLTRYGQQGFEELDAEKHSALVRLCIMALHKTFAEVGKPRHVRKVLPGFQWHVNQSQGG